MITPLPKLSQNPSSRLNGNARCLFSDPRKFMMKIIKALRYIVPFCKKKLIYNALFFQKRHWIKAALASDSANLAYRWGDPEDSAARLGDYKRVKDVFLLPNIVHKDVLEIGCFDGKWSKYLLEARSITLVDLDKRIVPILEKRLEGCHFRFYQTKGYELDGVESNSIDFIFSMDALVRTPVWAICRYMKQFRRVIRPGGKLLLHLPCNLLEGSRKKAFVSLKKSTIIEQCISNGFSNYQLDVATIYHGVLLKVNYE